MDFGLLTKGILGALYVMAAWGGGNIPLMFIPLPAGNKLVFTTSTRTVATTWLCSGAGNEVTIESRDAGGNPIVQGSPLTVTLTVASNNMRFFSDSSCATPITTATITAGNSSTTIYFIAYNTGTLSIGVSATNYAAAAQNQSITARIAYTWIGGTSNALGTGSNWQGGAAPGAGTMAYFDATCTTFCSPTGALTALGVSMAPNYTGTITHGGLNPVTIGASGLTMRGGTVSHSSNSYTVNGPLNLSGGTFNGGSGSIAFNGAVTLSSGSIRFSSSTTTISNAYTVSGSPTFNMNSGTVAFTGNGVTVAPGSETYNNVTLTPGGTLTISGTMNTSGTLTANTGCCLPKIQGGTINVTGDVSLSGTAFNQGNTLIVMNGTGAQSLTVSGTTASLGSLTIDKASGTLSLSGLVNVGHNYTFQQGTLSAGTSTVQFSGYGTSTITVGTEQYYNVNIGFWTAGLAHTLSGTMTVLGDLYGASGCCSVASLSGGTIQVYGKIHNLSSFYHLWDPSGTTDLQMIGSNSSDLGSTGNNFPSFPRTTTLNRNGQTITMQSNLTGNAVGQTFTVSAGTTLNMNNFNLNIRSLSLPTGATINRGTGTLTVNGSSVGACGPCAVYGGGTIN